jgi:hypothetical protein
MRRLLAAATTLAWCALAGCGDRAEQPAREDPRLGELQQRVQALEKTVGNLQAQPRPAARPSREEQLVGNWSPKQAGAPAWLLGLRLEGDRTCRFTLQQPGGMGELFKGSYALVGKQLVIDVSEPTRQRTFQWEVRSLSEQSLVLRRPTEGGMPREVRLQRQ